MRRKSSLFCVCIFNVHRESEKRNPFSFNTQLFLIRNIIWQNFVFLFINELSSMLCDLFLSCTLRTLPRKKVWRQYYVINHGVQDSAPVHHSQETVDLPSNETPDNIELMPPLWAPNSPDYIRLITVFVGWYRTESANRRMIMLMSWSNELGGCAMRWNRLSISGTKDFKCMPELAAVILNIWCGFVLAALSVFVDDKDIPRCVSAKLAKPPNCW